MFVTVARVGPSARMLKNFFQNENVMPYAFPAWRRTESSGELGVRDLTLSM